MNSLDNHLFIEASAGTGKTTKIVNLFIELLKNNSDLKISDILCITFTRKATQELKERIQNQLDEQGLCGKDNFLSQHPICVYSQHEFFYHLLNCFQPFTLFDDQINEKEFNQWVGDQGKKILQSYFENTDLQGKPFTKNNLPYFVEWGNQFTNNWNGYPIPFKKYNDFWYEKLPYIVKQFSMGYLSDYQDLQQSKILEPQLLNEQSIVYVLKQYKDSLLQLQQNIQDLPFLISDSEESIEVLGDLIDKRSSQKFYHLLLSDLYFLQNSNTCKNYTEEETYQSISSFLNFFEKIPTGYMDIFDKVMNNTTGKKAFFKKNACLTTVTVIQSIAQILFENIRPLVNHLGLQLVVHLVFDIKKLDIKKPSAEIQHYDDIIKQANQMSYYYRLYKNTSSSQETLNISHYRYVFIDEFQDTSFIEYETIKQLFLLDRHVKLIIVGDPKQSIYSFRGGDRTAYDYAKKELTEIYQAKISCLDVNYRTQAPLLNILNEFFKSSYFFGSYSDYYQSIAAHKPQEYTPYLNLLNLKSDQNKLDETSMIHFFVEQIKEKQNQKQLSEYIAVLCITNKQVDFVFRNLKNQGIPVHYYRKSNTNIASELHHICKVLTALKDSATEVQKIVAYRTPFFAVSWEKLQSIDKELQQEIESKYSILKKIAEGKNWGKLAYTLIEFLKQKNPHINTNIYQEYLYTIIEKLMEKQYLLQDIDSIYDSIINQEQTPSLSTDSSKVQVLTIHASKGLDFDHVLIWDTQRIPPSKSMPSERLLKEGEFPQLLIGEKKYLSHSHLEKLRQQKEKEDRNLYYVALTRAKKSLTIPCYLSLEEEKSKDSTKHNHFLSLVIQECYQRQLFNQEGVRIYEIDSFDSLQKFNLINNQIYDMSNHEQFLNLDYPKIDKDNISNLFESYTSLQSLYKKEYITLEKDHQDFEMPEFSYSEDSFFSLPYGKETGILLHSLLENIQKILQKNDQSIEENKIRLLSYIYTKMRQIDFFDISFNSIGELLEGALENHYFFKWPLELKKKWWNTSKDNLLKDYQAVYTQHSSLLSDNKNKDYGIYQLKSLFLLENIFSIKLPHQLLTLKEIFMKKQCIQEMPIHYPWDISNRIHSIKSILDCVFYDDNERFYWIDWKTDILPYGYYQNSVNYHIQQNYQLQWKMYCIALVELLENSLKEFNYEKHIGGFYYLFLRGLENSSNGVFYHQLSYKEYKQMKSQLYQQIQTLHKNKE